MENLVQYYTNPWVITVACGVSALLIFKLTSTKKPKLDEKPGIVYMHQLPPALGKHSASPFCVKLETWLRLANAQSKKKNEKQIIFELVNKGGPGPKGKWPFISLDGNIVGDSAFVIKFLRQKYAISLDEGMNDQESAIAKAFERLIEDHLYFGIVYDRWIVDENWKEVKPEYFKFLPGLLRILIADFLVRPKVRKMLYGQGTARHSKEEIYEVMREDLQALSKFLGNKKYLFGDTPRSIDTTFWAFLYGIIGVSLESPMKKYCLTLKNLVDYYQRFNDEFMKE